MSQVHTIEKPKTCGVRVYWGNIGIVIALVALSLGLEFGLGVRYAWAIVVSGLFVVFGAIHEVHWLGKRPGKLVEGVIVGLVDDGGDGGTVFYPKIEYVVEGAPQTFVSEYAQQRLQIGQRVTVWVPEYGGSAEWYSLPQRVFYTVVPIAIGLAGLVAYFAS
jgi:hypothetical protein